ncbi:MAG: hypothetical protein H6Q75_1211 [Firmicutes bacterium]|nr:hypothetical protein [Bacillota bacterium]
MITIEPIKFSDLEAFSQVIAQLFGAPSTRQNLEHSLKNILNDPAYLLLGAKENDRLVGTVMGITCFDTVGECQPFMVLENLVVDKECKGKGIGKRLVQAAEEYAHKQNCYYIMLLSSSYRTEAHRFYEAIGYSSDAAKGFKKYL